MYQETEGGGGIVLRNRKGSLHAAALFGENMEHHEFILTVLLVRKEVDLFVPCLSCLSCIDGKGRKVREGRSSVLDALPPDKVYYVSLMIKYFHN